VAQYVPAKHWKRAARKLRKPVGLKRLRKRIRRMQLREAGAMTPKERRLAAWSFGPWLTRTEVEWLPKRNGEAE